MPSSTANSNVMRRSSPPIRASLAAQSRRFTSRCFAGGARRDPRNLGLQCRMKNSEVPMMALRRAVQICNGLDALGDALNVSTDALERMLAGEEELPEEL